MPSAAVVPFRNHIRASARTALIEAAEHIAAAEGAANTSLQAIAKRAGIAVGTIYNYFEDRQDLFGELMARRREELYAAIDESAKRHARAPFEVQLDAFVRTVLSFFDERKAFLRIALDTETGLVVRDDNGSRRSTMAQLETRAASVIRIGLRDKHLRDGTAQWYATILAAILRGVLVADAEADSLLVARTESIIDMFLHGAGR